MIGHTMGLGRWRLATAGAAAVSAVAGGLLAPVQAYPRPASVERVSLSSTGVQGNDDSGRLRTGFIHNVSMSADGRYVAFASEASNLTPNDVNRNSDVFVRDRRTGKTVMVSAPLPGTPVPTITSVSALATCGAFDPSISPNGRYVAFTSCYPYLDKKPIAAIVSNVFVHDMRTGKNVRASVSSSGGIANGSSDFASVSANGRYVTFQSAATNLVSGECAGNVVDATICGTAGALLGATQVFRRDLQTGITKLVSTSATGALANGSSYYPSISADGRYVAFTSAADNLTSNDSNSCPLITTPSCPDVYLKDVKTRSVQLISVALNGQAPLEINSQGAATGSGAAPATRMISDDDRYVIFQSSAAAFVPNDAAGVGPLGSSEGIYVRDLVTKRTERFSVDSSGTPLSLGLSEYAVDPTGRYAAFDATPACGAQYAEAPGLFIGVHDAVTGATNLAGMFHANGGKPDCQDKDEVFEPALSSGARSVAFASDASDLVSNDSNGKWDVFVQDVGPSLGAGRVGTAPTLAGDKTFSRRDVAVAADPARDVSAALAADGLNLTGVSLAYRGALRDLFVRLDVQHMPPFLLADPAVVYGVDFAANGVRYQVRAAKTGARQASFSLLTATGHGGWRQIGTLRGGYGTTGQEVVAAVPLADIAATSALRLSHVHAFTALDGLGRGSLRVVDAAWL